MRWLEGITDSMDMGLGRLWQLVMDREAWCAAIFGIRSLGSQRVGQLSNWTEKQNPDILKHFLLFPNLNVSLEKLLYNLVWKQAFYYIFLRPNKKDD